jgi:hypothetical protein
MPPSLRQDPALRAQTAAVQLPTEQYSCMGSCALNRTNVVLVSFLFITAWFVYSNGKRLQRGVTRGRFSQIQTRSQNTCTHKHTRTHTRTHTHTQTCSASYSCAAASPNTAALTADSSRSTKSFKALTRRGRSVLSSLPVCVCVCV